MRALPLVFLLAFFTILTADLDAQVNRGISAAGRRMDDWDNARSKADRDNMQKEMRGRKPTKEELRNAARIKAETKEDLEGLQENYNDIILKLSGGQRPETSFAVDVASKVNKHATRLKANIVFPKPEKEEETKPIEVDGDLRKQLRELSTLIYQFLTNSMVENPNVLDLGAAHAARRQLDAIILLSERAAKN